jgi:hypothetical protein
MQYNKEAIALFFVSKLINFLQNQFFTFAVYSISVGKEVESNYSAWQH